MIPTGIGGALFFGLRAIADAPCQAEQEVIDLATYGEAAEAPVQAARAYAEALGIRINALGVGAPEAAAPGREHLREHAVTGTGFALAAESWERFPLAIWQKLTVELAAR